MRKQRTREHVIEDLGFNYVERQVLYAGYTVLRYPQGNDYSYDGLIQTFNEIGEVQTFRMLFQLKSTDAIQFSGDSQNVVFDLSIRDLEYWLSDTVKMLLILYDAKKEIAYFVDLQDYSKDKNLALDKNRKFLRIHIPIENVVTADNFQKIYQLNKL